jgi:hypothetical protein
MTDAQEIVWRHVGLRFLDRRPQSQRNKRSSD